MMLHHTSVEGMMPVEKIAITLDRELVKEIDRGVKSGLYRNRSRAIEEAVREKLDRHRRRRLSVEARKLDRKEETALAEEAMTGEESTWPEYREERCTGLISIPSAVASKPAVGLYS
jgi:Arc/MetJ-type ribon-helix-helix transcriptional regulator